MATADQPTGCPHCQNRYGFAFGTCIDCGWNHLTNRFMFVRVWLDDAPDLDPSLIVIHARRSRRPPKAQPSR